MSPDEHTSQFQRFVNHCVERLKLGQEIYGSKMFDEYSASRLARERQEELIDYVLYGYALWLKEERRAQEESAREMQLLYDEMEREDLG